MAWKEHIRAVLLFKLSFVAICEEVILQQNV
jgi:hypothetical protein